MPSVGTIAKACRTGVLVLLIFVSVKAYRFFRATTRRRYEKIVFFAFSVIPERSEKTIHASMPRNNEATAEETSHRFPEPKTMKDVV
jgi:hypothetical protein